MDDLTMPLPEPYWPNREAKGRHVVEYFDLRFSLEGLGLRRRPFIMQVVLDDQGRVISEGFDR